VVRERDRGGGGLDIEVEAAREAVQVRQVGGPRVGIHCWSFSSLAGSGLSMAAKDPIRLARAFISGQADASRTAVSRCPSVRFPGLVSRIRVALRGAWCGRSALARPWLR